jgi:hypothetical protein
VALAISGLAEFYGETKAGTTKKNSIQVCEQFRATVNIAVITPSRPDRRIH